MRLDEGSSTQDRSTGSLAVSHRGKVAAGAVGGTFAGAVIGDLSHAAPPWVIIAALAVSLTATVLAYLVRVREVQAGRSPAQIRANALASSASRIADPELAVRLLILASGIQERDINT